MPGLRSSVLRVLLSPVSATPGPPCAPIIRGRWRAGARAPQRLTAAVAALLVAVLLLLGGAAAARAGSVSGTVGDLADYGLTYTITGGDFALKPGATDDYTGTYSGSGPITISGTITVTRGPGVVSGVSMSASITSAATWAWPADGSSQDVSGATVTQSYSLSYTPTAMDTLRGFVYGGAGISVCGGICGHHYVSFDLNMPKQPAQTEAPTAQALPLGKTMVAGKKYYLPYRIKDATGEAFAYADVFEGGTNIGHAESNGMLKATGSINYAHFTPSAKRTGPLYLCVWAKNASGATSVNAPNTSCAWATGPRCAGTSPSPSTTPAIWSGARGSRRSPGSS